MCTSRKVSAFVTDDNRARHEHLLDSALGHIDDADGSTADPSRHIVADGGSR
jgi:hypothetical protein